MTNLHTLSIEECKTPLDWLVDDILVVSYLTSFQSIYYEDNFPFFQKVFTRLIALSADPLKELTIQSPSYEVNRLYGNGVWGGAKKAIGDLLKERLERFGKKLKIEWVNKNPGWGDGVG
ncbi:uncharacterized protein EV420DRAFT_1746802 [Desarmillaria tabescens]|uniref:Uncharacterized protein n=1 Tax=Armillaria tabescens TaxID=1929756 RepID=A0AA39TV46_ARMTA|nr:uncharacterized protein EV420DRAFT_1746802 [Desarmillaria tabescens]KAK0460560.1 hypothetical protein EV420DRAFT_1746802 [Desarmillaria tabescens]